MLVYFKYTVSDNNLLQKSTPIKSFCIDIQYIVWYYNLCQMRATRKCTRANCLCTCRDIDSHKFSLVSKTFHFLYRFAECEGSHTIFIHIADEFLMLVADRLAVCCCISDDRHRARIILSDQRNVCTGDICFTVRNCERCTCSDLTCIEIIAEICT